MGKYFGSLLNHGGKVIEEPESLPNLLTFPEEFDNAAWTKFGIISVNTINAPDGTLTADGLRSINTSVGEKTVTQTPTVELGIEYCFSAHVKKGTVNWVYLTLMDPGNARWTRYYFNIDSGVVGSSDGSWGINYASGIEDVGDGWFRPWVAHEAAASGSMICRINAASADGTKSYTATNTTDNQIYLWGAKLNTGLVPSEYP